MSEVPREEAGQLLTPYGGASPEAVDGFPEWTRMVPLPDLEPFVLDIGYACEWVFWSDRTGGVTLALNVPGQPGMVKPVLDLPAPPSLWWDLTRSRAGLLVAFFPDLRDPLGDDISTAQQRGDGFGAWARRVGPPSADLQPLAQRRPPGTSPGGLHREQGRSGSPHDVHR